MEKKFLRYVVYDTKHQCYLKHTKWYSDIIDAEIFNSRHIANMAKDAVSRNGWNLSSATVVRGVHITYHCDE